MHPAPQAGNPAAPRKARPLGTVAKSAPARGVRPVTEVAPGRRPARSDAAGQARADEQRYRMQRAAQRIMTWRPEDWRMVPVRGVDAAGADYASELRTPRYRVAVCHRWSHGPGPALWRSPAGDAAEFADVHTCGSVWHCPICAPKITSGRRDELQAAIAAWTGRGGAVYLGTRTFSHDKRSLELQPVMVEVDGKFKRVSPLLDAFSDALSRAKGTRRALATAERAGVVGTVRSLEVTQGEINGWHPHTHELIFARPGEQARLLSHRNGWIRELIKRGLAGMRDTMTRAERAEQLRYLRRHAYTVQLGDKASEYVAKFGMEPATENGGRWGEASELTRGHLKTGTRLTGRTPFELLRLYTEGDKRAGCLFREFAEAFHGRAQLFWSPGLRASLVELCEQQAAQLYHVYNTRAEPEQTAIEADAWGARARYIGRNKSDEDYAATRSADCSEFVKRLSRDEWGTVLRANARFELRLAAQLGGAPEVDELLERLRRERARDDDSAVSDWRRFDAGRGRWRDLNGERLHG